MLVEFEFGNFKSFKEKSLFSMEAAKIDDLKEHLIDNKYLKTSAILGANASGKSNLVKAFVFLSSILESLEQDSIFKDLKEVQAQLENIVGKYEEDVFFKLDLKKENEPIFFRIIFFEENSFFEYLIEIDKNKNILNEELYQKEIGKNKKYLFKRNNNKIIYNKRSFKEAKDLEEKTREDVPFLSVVNQFNGKISRKVYNYLTKKIIILDLDCNFLVNKLLTISYLQDENLKNKTLEILKELDFSIKDIFITKKLNIKTKKYLFENEKIKGFKEFYLQEESAGTQKLVFLLPLLIETLENNGVLIIDELDNSLHSLIVENLIKWFAKNSMKAQFIFTTHDLNILDKPEVLRRDEIWFVNKNPKYEYSELYSLIEFNVRKDKNILKGLLKGEFGAIPLINNLGN